MKSSTKTKSEKKSAKKTHERIFPKIPVALFCWKEF